MLHKKYNENHQVVCKIDHMSDLDVDSGFHKQSMKIDKYAKINPIQYEGGHYDPSP